MSVKTRSVVILSLLVLPAAVSGQEPRSAEVQLTATGYGASIAAAGPERFVVTWNDVDDGTNSIGVFGRIYQGVGRAAGLPFRVNPVVQRDQYLGQVAADARGNFVVVWESHQSNNVEAQLFGREGARKGRTFAVNLSRSSDGIRPAVAMSPAGDFVVVWRESSSETGESVRAARFSATGRRRGVETDLGIAGGLYVDSPFVVLEPGGFAAGWTEYRDCGHSPAFPTPAVVHFDLAGHSTAPPFRLKGSDPCHEEGWQVGALAAGPAGTLALLDGAQDSLQFFEPDSHLPVPRRVLNGDASCDDAFCENAVALAMDGSGRFVLLTQTRRVSRNGSQFDLFAQLFDTQGRTVGPRFQVNRVPSFERMNAALALTDDGTLLVAWDRKSGEPGGEGLFLRWFHVE